MSDAHEAPAAPSLAPVAAAAVIAALLAALLAWLVSADAGALCAVAGVAVVVAADVVRHEGERRRVLRALIVLPAVGLLALLVAGRAAGAALVVIGLSVTLLGMQVAASLARARRAAWALRGRETGAEAEEDVDRTAWRRDRTALALVIPVLAIALLLSPLATPPAHTPAPLPLSGNGFPLPGPSTEDPGAKDEAVSRTGPADQPPPTAPQGPGDTAPQGPAKAAPPPPSVSPPSAGVSDVPRYVTQPDEDAFAILRRTLAIALLLAVAVAVTLVVVLSRRRGEEPKRARVRRFHQAAWDRLMAALARRGHVRRPSQTSDEFAAAVIAALGEDLAPLADLTRRHEAFRFGGFVPEDGDSRAMDDLRRALKRVAATTRR